MIVVDASVLASALGDDHDDGKAARRYLRGQNDLAAPDLLNVDTVAVLRKRWIAGDLTDQRFSAAIDDLDDLDLARYRTLPFMRRAFELRANLTTYDAVYIALAEQLRCILVTSDVRLAAAPGVACPVDVLRP